MRNVNQQLEQFYPADIARANAMFNPKACFDSLVKPFPKEYHKPFDFSNPGFIAALGGAAPSGPIGYWKELSRKELVTSAPRVEVTGLTSHRYYMYLIYPFATATTDLSVQLEFNQDTSSVYARRSNINGGSDGTQVNLPFWNQLGQGHGENFLGVGYLSNILGEEKLGITHVNNGLAGAANYPRRAEHVGKFVPSPDANVTAIGIYDNASAAYDYDVGSQVIVLGWVDTLTHGITDNFWKQLARVELGSANANLSTGIFTAKEWLMVRWYIKPSGTITFDESYNNVVSGNPYAKRRSLNGGADTTNVSQNVLNFDPKTTPVFITQIIRNQSDKEKLSIDHVVQAATAGAGNAPGREERVTKWDSVAAQITELDMDTSTSTYAAGSFVEVWGSD